METEHASKPPTEADEPLLPRILTRASAYLWLWVLPVAILLLLNLQSYWLIEGNLSDEERHLAYWLGALNVLNLGLGLVFWGLMKASPKLVKYSVVFAIPILLIQVGYLWFAVSVAFDMLPQSVTTWIFPESRYFYYQFAFCMLPLFWAIIRIACGQEVFLSNSAWKNIGLAIAAPVLLYLFFQVLNLFNFSGFGNAFGGVLIAVLVVLLSILMFVGLIRALMLLFNGLNGWSQSLHGVAIAFIALLMPLGGLLLNRKIPFPVDFQAWEVYALVVLNTAVLLWAVLVHTRSSKFSVWLLSASFPFTLYFFVVFLPYTPLSILGCLALGSGFLVLTPTFLFTLHLFHLVRLGRFARETSGKHVLLIGSLIACMLLPGFFTARGLMDKAALNEALDYVYTPNLESKAVEYNGSRVNLRRALASHRNYKNGIYYPLLSDYYSWLVFDNLVLPDDKIERLEARFFSEKGSDENLDPLRHSLMFWGNRNVRGRASMPQARPPSREVEILKQSLVLTPSGAHSTQATLRIKLENVSAENTQDGAEYIQQIPVPPGVLISGFRLDVNGVSVPGRIFEKKTALWVYTMIRDTERRDPGLLFYNHPYELELRVFPVMRSTPAVVEIDFLIPDRLTSTEIPAVLPDPSSLLSKLYAPKAEVARGDNFTYIAPLVAEALPGVDREHYLHLIIDRSAENAFEGGYSTARRIIEEAFPQVELGKATLVNYDVIDLEDSADPYTRLPIGGGFDLDSALAHAIAKYTRAQLDSAGSSIPPEPIFLVLGKTALADMPDLKRTRIWQSHLSDLQIYSAGEEGTGVRRLSAGSEGTVPIVRVGQSLRPAHNGRSMIFPYSDLAPAFYNPETVHPWEALTHESHSDDDPWAAAIKLWVQNHRYAASPGSADFELKDLVLRSRQTGILIPATSYIVVENDAQWRMLELKEGQKLEQNEALDLLETPEPSIWILGLGLGAWLFWRRRLLG